MEYSTDRAARKVGGESGQGVGAATFSAQPLQQRLSERAARAGVTTTEMCVLLGVPRRTMHRVLRSTRLRWDTADRMAIALGHHPHEVWPEWFAPSFRRIGS
jgi:lambda repressor-like predicted transcriptional regulator